MTQEIKCPECDTLDPEIVSIQEEVVRVTRYTEFHNYGYGFQIITNERTGGEYDSEVIDTYDDENFRCESCGFTTDYPDDFIHETEDDEE